MIIMLLNTTTRNTFYSHLNSFWEQARTINNNHLSQHALSCCCMPVSRLRDVARVTQYLALTTQRCRLAMAHDQKQLSTIKSCKGTSQKRTIVSQIVRFTCCATLFLTIQPTTTTTTQRTITMNFAAKYYYYYSGPSPYPVAKDEDEPSLPMRRNLGLRTKPNNKKNKGHKRPHSRETHSSSKS